MAGIGQIRAVLVLVAASGLVAATAAAADEKDVVGTWKLSYNPGDRLHEPTLTVTKEASGLKGKFDDGDGKLDAKDIRFKDGKLSFTIEVQVGGDTATVAFKGEVKGDAIEGEGDWEYQGMTGTFPFDGKHEAAKPKE